MATSTPARYLDEALGNRRLDAQLDEARDASRSGDQPEMKTFRKAQWIFLGPVAAAPLAHIFVTGLATYPKRKKMWLGLIAAATVSAVGTRMWLMYKSGYPGAESIDESNTRYVTVPADQVKPFMR